MKSERIEMAALGAVVGPVFTPQEIETQRYLADLAATTASINELPRDVRMERCHSVLSGIVKAADAEAVRAAFWNRTPLAARRVAMMAANLSKDRAASPLADLDAFERGRVFNALAELMGNLANLQKCMSGGKMPATAGMRADDHIDHRGDTMPAARFKTVSRYQ